MGVLITYKDILENLIELNQSNYAFIATGKITTTTANKLTDSTANFTSAGVNLNMIAENKTKGLYALISALDSATVLSVDENNFTLNDEYIIYSTDEYNIFRINRAIAFVEQFIFDKLRGKYQTPETTLLTQKTVIDIAIKLTVCRIFKIVYKMNVENLPESIKELCAEGSEMLDALANGEILLDIGTAETTSKIYSTTDTKIFKQNDYLGNYETEDYWTPDIEINRIR